MSRLDLRTVLRQTWEGVENIKRFTSRENKEKLDGWTISEFYDEYERLVQEVEKAKQKNDPTNIE